jgi:ERCC4-type nuclease
MLEADVHEPTEKFLTYVRPAVDCKVTVLNEHLWADYRWKNHDGSWTQVERKTWGEILANVDSVEDQLRRHLKNQPEARLLFILEGMVEDTSDGVHILTPAKSNNVWVKGYRSGTRIGRIYSWLYNASQYVEVFQTFSYELTCQFLVQAYKQDQKPPEEHKTFNRYFKKVTFHPNSQVLALMGMIPGLGEVKAEALIERFNTVWNVLSASPADLMTVDGIGKGMANTMLQRIGRMDV